MIPSQKEIKIYSSLKHKKYRKKYGLFLIEGLKVIREAVTAGIEIERIFVNHSVSDIMPEVLNIVPEGVPVSTISDKIMNRIADTKSPPPCLGIAKIPAMSKGKKDSPQGNALVLHQLQEPGNIGTIIRSALWFGIDTVYFSQDSVDVYHPKFIRSCMGANFHLNVEQYEDIDALLKSLKRKGFAILAADMNGIPVGQIQLLGKSWALILGNEGHGLNKHILNHADSTISIPAKKRFDSLNVSVASGILLYELSNLRRMNE